MGYSYPNVVSSRDHLTFGFPSVFSKLTNLTSLSFKEAGFGRNEIPQWIFRDMTKLTALCLVGNRFEKDLKELLFPTSVLPDDEEEAKEENEEQGNEEGKEGKEENEETLWIEPEEPEKIYTVANLKHLKYLEVSHAPITGTVPLELSQCSGLLELNFCWTNVEGVHPLLIDSIPSLIDFRLNDTRVENDGDYEVLNRLRNYVADPNYKFKFTRNL